MSKEYNDRHNKPLINPAFQITMKEEIKMVEVIEVVQFDTKLVEGKNFAAQRMALAAIAGTYGQPQVKQVHADKKPFKGYVWFTEGPDGNTHLYKQTGTQVVSIVGIPHCDHESCNMGQLEVECPLCNEEMYTCDNWYKYNEGKSPLDFTCKYANNSYLRT